MADEPTTTVTEFAFGPKHKRGVCRHCGKPAWDGRATSCGEKGRCITNDGAGKPAPNQNVKAAATGDDPTVIVVDVPEPTKDKKKDPPAPTDAKGKRAAEIEALILGPVNDFMPSAMAMACRPADPAIWQTPTYDKDGNVTGVVPTDLGRMTQWNPTSAKVIGYCVAELESSPVMGMASAALAPAKPIAYTVALVGVVGWQGYQLMQLRQAILQSVAQAQQNAAMEQAAPAAPFPADFVADETTVTPTDAAVLRPQFTPSQVQQS